MNILKELKSWRLAILAGLFILGLGLTIRLLNLTILPVFADEAIYIRWSQIMNAESTLRFLPLSDGKQPLYMWILMFLVNRFTDPLFIGRLVSVLSGMGSMVGLFALTHVLFKSKKLSLVAMFIWALSPYSFFFDRMALVDSMLVAFGIWTAFLGVMTVKTKRLDYAMLTGFALGFAGLTKSSAIFFALVLPTTWILTDWEKNVKKVMSQLIRLSSLFGVSYLIAYAMYNIQRLGPNFHLLTSRTADYIFPLSHLWTNPRDPFVFYFDRAFEWLSILGPWPIFILATLGVVANFKKYRKELIVLTSWWIVPTLIQSEFAKVFTARYELFTIPFLFAIAASGILAKGRLKTLYLLGLGLFTVLALTFNYKLITNPDSANLPRSEKSGYLEEWTSGQGIKEVSRYLKEMENDNPDEKIVVGTEGYFGTLPDGLQMYLAGNPKITVIGVGVDLKEVPKSLIESKAAGNKTYLVINKSRLMADPTVLGLELIAEYPKSPRPTDVREYSTKGPQEFLYFFELK